MEHILKSKTYSRLVPDPSLWTDLLRRENVAEHVFEVSRKPGLVDQVGYGMTCQVIRSGSPWAFGQVCISIYLLYTHILICFSSL